MSIFRSETSFLQAFKFTTYLTRKPVRKMYQEKLICRAEIIQLSYELTKQIDNISGAFKAVFRFLSASYTYNRN
ncbi:CLUMA_CG006161, isoform A [Clunio marinus]|uniref:CLUMA_CG006161, isoform A n=1 Tax=Clunio marinus TaxID=568069 RepID=A0A1J1HX73_9DIPT|nr:CLUMA_CG006161, isoform A [Clunio marinus]